MALLGCDVTVTDQKEVLPLLQRNVDRNISRVMQKNPESFGSIKVSELQWGDESHIKAVCPPFDYIIGTDVVYVEHLLEPLLQTILALSGPRTTILLGYEIRSTSVHEKMLQMWKKNFDVKTVSKSKMADLEGLVKHRRVPLRRRQLSWVVLSAMVVTWALRGAQVPHRAMDETFQHPNIQLFIMGFNPLADSTETSGQAAAAEKVDVETGVQDKITEENIGVEGSDLVEENTEDDSKKTPQNAKLSEWEARSGQMQRLQLGVPPLRDSFSITVTSWVAIFPSIEVSGVAMMKQ
ncbi:hypothetical protein L195_g028642 [Trifolium pratense]|uniref:Uncharacterized protein n=1 Tax=Trifolium pratense TaxID=57577 RepID=A0A2K3L2H4_TRIPR|nr:hypothetical protein L195_g028642 [Trifolium pratense]